MNNNETKSHNWTAASSTWAYDWWSLIRGHTIIIVWFIIVLGLLYISLLIPITSIILCIILTIHIILWSIHEIMRSCVSHLLHKLLTIPLISIIVIILIIKMIVHFTLSLFFLSHPHLILSLSSLLHLP